MDAGFARMVREGQVPKKRRLTDLYVVGRDVVVDDGNGEPVTVYVRKLNPVDHETALRHANAARSRTTAMRSDPTSDEHVSLSTIVENYTVDDLIEYLAEDLKQNRLPILRARVADEEKWSKENYLQGLTDAWESSLSTADPEDPEVVRVKAELDRYEAEVQAELTAEVDDLQASYADRTVEDLRNKVLDKIFEVRASIAWLNEFRRCEVWLSVRDTDRKTRYFPHRDEIDELEAPVLQQLTEAYLALSVDPTEGKDSAAILPSSLSSGQPEEPVTAGSSGPENAAA